MALCRYLPTPSARMSTLWSLLAIQDSIVLEYGPAGTTHYSVSLFGKMGIDQEERLFTTHMDEEDVIMGDVTRLEASILELDMLYKPKVIFVVGSSISAVIGTDIKGVCRYMQEKVEAKLICFEDTSFKGDYSMGLMGAYEQLIKAFAQERTHQSYQYNIIGASVGAYRVHSDLIEIERLLKEAYSLEKGTTLCHETSIEAIEKMTEARVNIVISYEGLKAAKWLEKKYGMPYVYGVPYGYKGTLEWLKAIGKCIQEPMEKQIQETLQQSIGEMMPYKMYRQMYKEKPKAYVFADYDRVVGLSQFMEELGMEVVGKQCQHQLKWVNQPDEHILWLEKEGERLEAFYALNKTFVLADTITIGVVNDSNTTLCVSAPVHDRPQIAKHLPLVGIRGADFIREYYECYLRKLR